MSEILSSIQKAVCNNKDAAVVVQAYADALNLPRSLDREAVLSFLLEKMKTTPGGDLELAEKIANRTYYWFPDGTLEKQAAREVYWSLFEPTKASGDLELAWMIAGNTYWFSVGSSERKQSALQAYWSVFEQAKASGKLRLAALIVFNAFNWFKGCPEENRTFQACWDLFELAKGSGDFKLAEWITNNVYLKLADGTPEKQAAKLKLDTIRGLRTQATTLAKNRGARISNQPTRALLVEQIRLFQTNSAPTTPEVKNP